MPRIANDSVTPCPIPEAAIGALAKQGRALWEEHISCAGFVEQLHAEEQQAIDEERAAVDAVGEEERLAVAEKRSPDVAVRERLRVAHEASNPEIWSSRVDEALIHSRGAVVSLVNFLENNALALAYELGLDKQAFRAAQAISDFDAEVTRKRQPLIDKYAAVKTAVDTLLGSLPSFTSADIPEGLTDAPWPSQEWVHQYRETYGPAERPAGAAA